MKTIIKYELIINKALRSALNYDTPDDQINEFIKFFGNHIGSDRIYIFEDNIKRHTTDNTYEWCADGVESQMEQLQNVDMEIIDWWYKSFDRGENVIVPNVEELKDSHAASYEILKAQKVDHLVVSPISYKDEICGFFGVDNPPKSDERGLSVFLEMIGTLLVSLLKMRNNFRKSENEAKISSFSALAQIYLSMYLIDMKTGNFRTIKSVMDIENSEIKEEKDNFSAKMKNFVSSRVTEKYVDSVIDFTDISTLNERMEGINTLSHEFLDESFGWCRERFIKVESDSEGNLIHVLYCIEVIDEEKRRENRLRYLSEIDHMTGICNRGSGEYQISKLLDSNVGGFMCLIDCDRFKSINDTYGHVVGDSVIVAVADVLSKCCGEKDILMRLGGDEFAIFVPELLDESHAEKFINKIFVEMEKISITEICERKISVSLGGSFYSGVTKKSFDELYRETDEAMYRSKKNGGHCATIYKD